jgi:hypothetical protein
MKIRTFNLEYSEYIKTEFDYQTLDLRKKCLLSEPFFGIAYHLEILTTLFEKLSGGSNDNRERKPYSLGPEVAEPWMTSTKQT